MFENAWLQVIGCRDEVKEPWDYSIGDDLPSRLDYCGTHLKRWGGDLGTRLTKNIESLQAQLNMLRGKADLASLAKVHDLDKQISCLHDQ